MLELLGHNAIQSEKLGTKLTVVHAGLLEPSKPCLTEFALSQMVKDRTDYQLKIWFLVAHLAEMDVKEVIPVQLLTGGREPVLFQEDFMEITPCVNHMCCPHAITIQLGNIALALLSSQPQLAKINVFQNMERTTKETKDSQLMLTTLIQV